MTSAKVRISSIAKPRSTSQRGRSMPTSGSPPFSRQLSMTSCTNSSCSRQRGASRHVW
jgi:hypothetical protein